MERPLLAIFVLLSLGVASPSPAGEPPSLADETAALATFREDRRAAVAGDNGWTTVVGLHWLKEGDNTFGRAADNAVRIPAASIAPHAGRIVVAGRKARLVPRPRSGVSFDGREAGAMDLIGEDGGDSVELRSGSFRLLVIERGGRLAVRVRDLESRARREFRGLDYFPVDPTWVVDARFERYEPVRHVPITNILGMPLDLASPGALVFERDGREWRLDALLESPDADQIFIMFADATSGHETYGAGRFFYVPYVATAETVRLDFNRAYNPPCAFTGFATCPLPPPQNRLTLAVRAGELRYAGESR